mgnify:CR=1 FL=1
MKKNILCLTAITCTLLLSFNACGKIDIDDIEVVEQNPTDTTNNTDKNTDNDIPDADPETNPAQEESDDTYSSQIQVLLDDAKWLSNNPNATYAFCDMDNNGRIDIIVCNKDANGEPAPPAFFEVSEDYSKVNECSFESNCYVYDFDTSTCEGVYVDSSTGEYSYLMKSEEEYEGKSLFYYYNLTLQKGAVSQYAVCSQNPMGYYSFRFESIPETEFNLENEIAGYYEGKSQKAAKSFRFDNLDGDGFSEKIAKSLDTFLK